MRRCKVKQSYELHTNIPFSNITRSYRTCTELTSTAQRNGTTKEKTMRHPCSKRSPYVRKNNGKIYIIKLIASRRHLLMCRHVTPNVSSQFPLIIQLRCNEFVEYKVETKERSRQLRNRTRIPHALN